jgi:hypothetical protein
MAVSSVMERSFGRPKKTGNFSKKLEKPPDIAYNRPDIKKGSMAGNHTEGGRVCSMIPKK